MTTTNNDKNFLLDELEVCPSRNLLILGDRSLTLQPKVMAVLHYLALNQERVVGSEELMAQLWKGRIVTQGSVQKSINSLRKAFAELLGERELITHYSKRGYQLIPVPVFLTADTQVDAGPPASARPPTRRIRIPLVAGLTAAGLGLCLLFLLARTTPEVSVDIDRSHKVAFRTSSEYTQGTGHHRDVEPHPDNRHLAYIREELTARDRWQIDSQIMVRNPRGEDWKIASSEGTWVSLAWSPEGRHLVAIELWRQEGLPPTPGFHERANYLYTFHVFSLDLDNHRLLEKHLLSQWQGRIHSVTWWDEGTLEFVAAQGPGSGRERYRYNLVSQQLSLVESPRSQHNPLASSIRQQRTALVSPHRHLIKVDLLDEAQASQASWQFDYPGLDISWIPDGSGVLVHAVEPQKLFALYVDGQMREIHLGGRLDRQISKPRFRPDGQAIYYTEEKRQTRIHWQRPGQEEQRLTDQSDLTEIAAFTPAGTTIAFTEVNDNQRHLWLRDGSGKRRLSRQPLAQPVSRMVWSGDGEWLVYKTGRRILFHELASGAETSLGLESASIEPLAFDADRQLLHVLKANGEASNLWSIQTQNLEQKQLTFGALGGALGHKGDIYFQYRSKPGLWVLRQHENNADVVAATLDANVELLAADDEGIYYVMGGPCRESDIYRLALADGSTAVQLARRSRLVLTHDFHPGGGLLQQVCALPEANILMLE